MDFSYLARTRVSRPNGQSGFFELSLRLKAGLEIGFRRLTYLVTATWKGKNAAISTGFGVSNERLIMRFEYATLSSNSCISSDWNICFKRILPITLSPVRNQTLEFFSVVVPSTALILGLS